MTDTAAWAMVFGAGLLAGLINGVVGSGTLISFPVLLLLGFPPVTANISNNLGLVPGALASALQNRDALASERSMLVRLVPLTAAGSLGGSLLLILLPGQIFEGVVPALIAVALLCVIAQPVFQSQIRRRRGTEDPGSVGEVSRAGRVALLIGLPLLGLYGGYFGAAQGILLLVLLGTVLAADFGSVNGFKNLLAFVANSVATVVFLALAFDRINWLVVALIAIGSVIGGVVGARWARRLPQTAYRIVILLVAAIALTVTLVRG